jgi:hypothetical protein
MEPCWGHSSSSVGPRSYARVKFCMVREGKKLVFAQKWNGVQRQSARQNNDRPWLTARRTVADSVSCFSK